MENRERRQRKRFDYRKIVLVAAGVVLFFLVMDLNNRLNELNRLSVQKDRSSTQVTILQATLDHLETQIYYSTSVSAVEQWAYEEGHMARPGDQVIIPVAPPGATQPPVFAPTPSPQPINNWDIWMMLLFNK
jgi:cell division protein FtsB